MITVALCFFRSTGAFIFSLPAGERPPYSDEASGPVVVELAGHTDKRGVYFLPEGSSVLDFVTMIGVETQPAPARGDLSGRLKSATVVTVGRTDRVGDPAVTVGRMNGAKRFALGLPMDLNEATSGDLDLVPGIGEQTAMRIIDYRRRHGGFKKVSDLKKVKGIKEKKYAALRHYFSVE